MDTMANSVMKDLTKAVDSSVWGHQLDVADQFDLRYYESRM